jgi:hypothetical protein
VNRAAPDDVVGLAFEAMARRIGHNDEAGDRPRATAESIVIWRKAIAEIVVLDKPNDLLSP